MRYLDIVVNFFMPDHLDGMGVARHIDAILTLPNLQTLNWVQEYVFNRFPY